MWNKPFGKREQMYSANIIYIAQGDRTDHQSTAGMLLHFDEWGRGQKNNHFLVCTDNKNVLFFTDIAQNRMDGYSGYWQNACARKTDIIRNLDKAACVLVLRYKLMKHAWSWEYEAVYTATKNYKKHPPAV